MTHIELITSLKVLLAQSGIPDEFKDTIKDILKKDKRDRKNSDSVRQVNIITQLWENISIALDEVKDEEAEPEYLDDFQTLCQIAANDTALENEFNTRVLAQNTKTLANIVSKIPANNLPIQDIKGNVYFLQTVVDNLINNNLTIDGTSFVGSVADKIAELQNYFCIVEENYLDEESNAALSFEAREDATKNLQFIRNLKERLDANDILSALKPQKQSQNLFLKVLTVIKKVLGKGSLIDEIDAFKAKLTNDTPDIDENVLTKIQKKILLIGKKYKSPSTFFALPSAEKALGEDMPIILHHFYQWAYNTPALDQWTGYTDLAEGIIKDVKERLKTNYQKNKIFPDYKHNLSKVGSFKKTLFTDDSTPKENPAMVFKAIMTEYHRVLNTKGTVSLNGAYLQQLKGTLNHFRGAMSDEVQVQYLILQTKHRLQQYLHDKNPGSVKRQWANDIMAETAKAANGLDPNNAAQRMKELVAYLMKEEKRLVLYDAKVYFGFITFGSHRLHTALTGIISDLKPFLPEVEQTTIDFSAKISHLAKNQGKDAKSFGYTLPEDQFDPNYVDNSANTINYFNFD